MPVLIVDTEQASLVRTAVEMLTAALMARSQRADPEKIISDSLALQANKLATVLAELDQPDPPEWSNLDASLRRTALNAMHLLATEPKQDGANALWAELRRVAITPGFAPAAQARHQPVSTVPAGSDPQSPDLRAMQQQPEPDRRASRPARARRGADGQG